MIKTIDKVLVKDKNILLIIGVRMEMIYQHGGVHARHTGDHKSSPPKYFWV